MPTTANSSLSFAGAYVRALSDVLNQGAEVPSVEDPNSIGSGFGQAIRPTLEIMGYAFEVLDPWSCVALSDARPLSLPFSVGLLLWTLAGSDDPEWISYYNPKALAFSDDGVHIAAAFGKRLFSFRDQADQIDGALKRLTMDPQSRRAVAVIGTPEDNFSHSRDYPCAIAVQYLQREGSLHAITYMRSQSALMVLPYDAFLFMSLQCWLASRLDLRVGTYKHVAGSFHVYKDELAMAERVVKLGASAASLGRMPVPEAKMDELLDFEKTLRVATLSRSASIVARIAENELNNAIDGTFFANARLILLLHASQTLELDNHVEAIVSSLPPAIALRLASLYREQTGIG